jgi:hypothetical protein
MPNQLNSGEIIANISSELADNNAGLISAFDVRHNMEDIAFSINKIVASGDTDVEFPFYNTVRVSAEDAGDPTSTTSTNGDLVVESGIFFPNSDVNPTERQTEPWLGEARIDHNNLDNLTVGDPHTQYYKLTGDRALEGNMSTDTFWINKSGVPEVGFKFEQLNGEATDQEIYVSGTMRWGDNSVMANAKGVAKAWINLATSGTWNGVTNIPRVYSWHNIDAVQRDAPGKFTITFTSGTFDNNDYIGVGTAIGRVDDAVSQEDFDVNTVGITVKSGTDDDLEGLRTCQCAVLNIANDFVDSASVDIVFYGYSPGENSGTVPAMTQSPTYSEG